MIENQLETSIISDLKVEVAMLKNEVSFINKLFEKMDILINKIDSQHDILVDKATKTESNLSFTREELAGLAASLEKTEKEISQRINSIENLLSAEIKTVNTKLSARIDKQEKFAVSLKYTKMVITGIVLLIGWAISNIEEIKSLM
jgi:hypothetical protein